MCIKTKKIHFKCLLYNLLIEILYLNYHIYIITSQHNLTNGIDDYKR